MSEPFEEALALARELESSAEPDLVPTLSAALERDRAVALVAMAWCSERVRRASELASALGHGPLADAVRHALGWSERGPRGWGG